MNCLNSRLQLFSIIFFIILFISCKKENKTFRKDLRDTFAILKGEWILSDFNFHSYLSDGAETITTSTEFYDGNTLSIKTINSNCAGYSYVGYCIKDSISKTYNYSIKLNFKDYKRVSKSLLYSINANNNFDFFQSADDKKEDWKQSKSDSLFLTFNKTIIYFKEITENKIVLSTEYHAQSPAVLSISNIQWTFIKQ